MAVRFLVDKELVLTLRLSESFFFSADYLSLLCSHRDQRSLLPMYHLFDTGRCFGSEYSVLPLPSLVLVMIMLVHHRIG